MGCVGVVLLWGFALASTAAACFFFWVGQSAHWTSDGPGMLFIMIGLALAGMVAFASWSSILASLFLREPEPPPQG